MTVEKECQFEPFLIEFSKTNQNEAQMAQSKFNLTSEKAKQVTGHISVDECNVAGGIRYEYAR